MSDVWAQVGPTVMELAVALVALAVGYAKSGLKELVTARTKEGVTRNALMVAQDTVMALVMQAQQTVVSELRKDLADGKITAAEFRNSLRIVRDSVLIAAKTLVGEKLGQALGLGTEAVGDLLEAKIEAAIPSAKAAVAVASAPLAANPSSAP
jgi:hypothetical protein